MAATTGGSRDDRSAAKRPPDRDESAEPARVRPQVPPGNEVDEASEESFPASDPPSFTPSRPGTPDEAEEADKG